MEHLTQYHSDVAHTTQHWQIYHKWKERFFLECFKAYVEGRSDRNPGDAWYDGETRFFDFYIISLAKKLKDCGVSSEEYLTYAQRNRLIRELRGRDIIDGMVEKETQYKLHQVRTAVDSK